MLRSAGPIEDHGRLDRLLEAAISSGEVIDLGSYDRFRRDLLRHIGMEEKVLLPFARTKRAGEPLPVAAALRADHARIAKLLTRAPTLSVVNSLREILARHNPLEEEPGGLYAACDGLAAGEAEEVVARLRAQPEVPVAKYYDGPLTEDG